MILSGSRIKDEINRTIIISPFDSKRINSNSYNLSLSSRLLVYDKPVLDMKRQNNASEIIIPEDGLVLEPHRLYLGSTLERTYTEKYIPFIEGRSSVARLGLFVHVTAGLGEAGFDGHWTLELVSVQPLKVYPNIPICQIYFHEISGKIDLCKSQKYQNSTEAMPSLLFKEIGDIKC